MISALIGTSTEPVIRNSSMKVASAISEQRVRQPLCDLVLEVDQERGRSSDVGSIWRRIGAQVVDQLLGGGVLRGAGRGDVDRGDVPGQARLNGDGRDPGQLPELFGVGGDAGVAGGDPGDDLDRVRLGAGEVRGQQVVHGPALEGGGQGARVAVGVVRAQERQGRRQQDGGSGDRDDDRVALHPTGQSAEEPLVAGGRGGL